jgi:hypothetical protein
MKMFLCQELVNITASRIVRKSGEKSRILYLDLVHIQIKAFQKAPPKFMTFRFCVVKGWSRKESIFNDDVILMIFQYYCKLNENRFFDYIGICVYLKSIFSNENSKLSGNFTTRKK